MSLQPYESHIPYLLHFLGDFNLSGCGWIRFDKFKQETDISEIREIDISADDIVIESLPGSTQLNLDSLRELQVQDAATRREMGVSAYTMTLKEPENTEIKWENYDSMHESLVKRLEVINSDPNPAARVHAKKTVTASTADDLEQNLPTQSSQLKPRDNSGPKFSERSLVEEYSLTAEAFSQKDAHEAYIRAASQIKGKGNLINPETAQRTADTCNDSSVDGAYTQVLVVPAPSTSEVKDTIGVSSNKRPFFGNQKDVPFFPFRYGGKEYKLKGKHDLPQFKFGENTVGNPLKAYINDFEDTDPEPESVFQLAMLPPSRKEVVEWCQKSSTSEPALPAHTMPSLGTFETEEDLTIMCLEVFTTVRKSRTPFAEIDPLEAVVWRMGIRNGVITTNLGIKDAKIVGSELELIENLVALVKGLDPDLLCGYETVSFSWGYVAERYLELTDNVLDIGRLKPGNAYSVADPILYPGRYLINIWQVLRHEINLPKYTLEVAIDRVFHHKTPHYSYDDLYEWWDTNPERVIDYFANRVRLSLELIHQLELIPKFSEQARIIGIDFYSCITRGSQFKVESVLYRLSRRKGCRLLSPSRDQVGQQAALERIPLVMEPKSDIYSDPVCVLDFRSLYPSIVIAFNLCYSTCIGRLDLWKDKNKLGVVPDLAVPSGLAPEDIFIAPNGIGYVKPYIWRSVLATMLKEILESRFMIKNSMKFKQEDNRYQRNMNGKQAALKFIANVTYGYVSASFSGRMPCAEIADTIVSTGRELLVKSIKIIEDQKKWGISPKVVYGDTDSLFVQLPGASKEQAFTIGQELADIVTAAFPSPIELEMEKVYKPCILLTKKRYVGLSYDSPGSVAKFDAKGTETIRRDGTPIESRLEKGALDRLFSGGDLSEVKSYLQSEWRDILDGKVNLKEFSFSQQVKLGNYKANASNLPPGAVVSLKRAAVDQGSAPQYNERVSYLIRNGLGNINERAVTPQEMINDPEMSIDTQYYILKNIIPPLERLFNIFGADVRSWYQEMPKPNRSNNSIYKAQCSVCHGRSDQPLCPSCRVNETESLYILQTRENMQLRLTRDIEQLCLECSGELGNRWCKSEDCSVYFDRERARRDLGAVRDDAERAMGLIDEP